MPTPTPENRLLSALPPDDYERLTARMTDFTFAHKEVAYRAGGPLDFVYFPRSGLMSSVVTMADGSTVEVGAVGREGIVGVAAFLGATRSTEEVFCQIPVVKCRRLPAAEFAAEVALGGPFQTAVYAYTQAVLATSARFTACNGLHTVDERCARWLLISQDRVGADEFSLTQEFLAMMLGVRRATVTVSAGSLQSAGMITYHHGRVTILDRKRLEEAACECYPFVRDAFTQLG